MIIDLPRFLSAGRPAWTELEKTLDKMDADQGFTMSFDELRHFYRLYQRVSADLAKLQTFASRPDIYTYLESLTARAYAAIHEARGRGGKRVRPWTWFVLDFPRAFQRHIRAFQLSVLVTIIGALFGAGAVKFDPDAKQALIPAQFDHLFGDPAKRVAAEEKRGTAANTGRQASTAAFLMQNNINVSIRAMAFGMTFGILTFVTLFYNGVIVGAVALDYLRSGEPAFLFGWLMPHGVIEIPAVLIGGQIGFVLAKALIGGKERSTLKMRLRAIGHDLVVLVGGLAVMLVWAGLVESFFSQYHEPVVPYAAKIAFGSVELVLLVWFLLRKLPPTVESEAAP